MNERELELCPFCGGEAKAAIDGAAWPLVICDPCGAYMEAIDFADDPVPRWNRRSPSRPLILEEAAKVAETEAKAWADREEYAPAVVACENVASALRSLAAQESA